MIDRYALPAMKSIWEEENKYKMWLKIELLVCEALFRLGDLNKSDIKCRIIGQMDNTIY